MTISQSLAPLKPTQSAKLPSGTVFYEEKGSGPPMLLLHGWGATSYYWQETMQRFSTIRTCYAPDMPGFGKSAPVLQTASAENLAEVMIDFADALDIDQFDVNGHSFGGAVAAYIAARWPKRVRHLVLSCFGTFGTALEQQMMAYAYYPMDLTLFVWKPWLILGEPYMAWWQSWFATVGCTMQFPHEVARLFFHELPDNDNLMCESFTDFMCMDYRTSLETALSLANPALRKAMKGLSVPTLIVGTRQDVMVPPLHVTEAARLIARCKLAWIDGCGHVPMIERPAEYHELLHHFLLQ